MGRAQFIFPWGMVWGESMVLLELSRIQNIYPAKNLRYNLFHILSSLVSIHANFVYFFLYTGFYITCLLYRDCLTLNVFTLYLKVRMVCLQWKFHLSSF